MKADGGDDERLEKTNGGNGLKVDRMNLRRSEKVQEIG